MTLEYDWPGSPSYNSFAGVARSAGPQKVLGGTALACVAFACAWTLYVNLAGNTDQIDGLGTRGDRLEVTASRSDKLPVARPVPRTNTYTALFDPRALGSPPGTFAKWVVAKAESATEDVKAFAHAAASAPVREARQTIASLTKDHAATPSAAGVPLHNVALEQDQDHGERIASDTPAEQPSFFQRLFGKPSGLALGYANPDDGTGSGVAASYGGQTAVYDISAHTVYMPDGTRLEAHSGLGPFLDDPRYADRKDRGVTPPDVYDLKLRESLFHGVQALRLIPVDEGKMFGRSGLLAHSFMLGPNGDSNGCVSFRNYDAFLHAYLSHEVKRLVVVAGRY